MTPDEYCAARAAPPGSSLYYAVLFHAKPERRALCACFALIEEIRRGAPESSDPAPVGQRLLWWLDELGDTRFAASRHPVLVEMRGLPISPADIRRAMEPAIHAVMNELSGWQPETVLDWQAHCRALTVPVWHLGAQICNPHLREGITWHIDTVATASGQLEQIRDLPMRVMAGRCPLPRSLLGEAGLAMPQGQALLADGRLHAAVTASLLDIYARLSPSTTAVAGNGAPPLFCDVLESINLALCEKMLRQPERLYSGRAALTPLRKLWIAWRSRRKTQTNP